MAKVDMRNLPVWRRNSEQTARTFLGKNASMADVSGLSKIIAISFEATETIVKDLDQPRFVVVEGRYARTAISDCLGHLPSHTTVKDFQLRFLAPSVDSLGIFSPSGTVEGKIVLYKNTIVGVYLFTGHGSIANYPSPRNLARYVMAAGIVSDAGNNSEASIDTRSGLCQQYTSRFSQHRDPTTSFCCLHDRESAICPGFRCDIWWGLGIHCLHVDCQSVRHLPLDLTQSPSERACRLDGRSGHSRPRHRPC